MTSAEALDAPTGAIPTALDVLDAVVAAAGGQARDGQRRLTEAIAGALDRRQHLVAEAPTGIGKSFALAAAAAAWLEGRRRREQDGRVVITTATRALQDQLIGTDLPVVAAAAHELGAGFSFALLKGRSNYLCRARLADAGGSLLTSDREAAAELSAVAESQGDGERSALPSVPDDVWRQLSVGAGECPGATRCSHGATCWTEEARRRAASADVVVVNTALYAAHLLAEGDVLPDHEVVVVDEAHALPSILVDAGTVDVSSGRLRALERTAGRHGAAEDRTALLAAADGIDLLCHPLDLEEVDPSEGDWAVRLAGARAAARALAETAGRQEGDEPAQAQVALTELVGDLDALLADADIDRVRWAEGSGRVRSAPVEAAPLAAQALWPGRIVIATSATLRGTLADGSPSFVPWLASMGAPADTETLAVDSPFDPRSQALLYVPRGRLPTPKDPGWRTAVADELWSLAVAAEGRTLALFTSRSATEEAAAALRAAAQRDGSDLEVLTQWDGSRDELVAALRERRRVVLCATRSYWTGVDLPGDACVLVAVDRVPFPRPDDPVVRARRRLATARKQNDFSAVDLPDAAGQLAQGAGRLLRSPTDRGVVAVLDTRLATSSWRQRILGALPPFRRTVDHDEVIEFLRGC